MSQVTSQVAEKQPVYNKAKDEKVLVVHRDFLFPQGAPQGLHKVDFDHYQKIVEKHSEYQWRSQCETDPQFKQIIPYLVFSHENKYFLMQRSNTSGDTRLHHKCSVGIGGHLRQEDMAGKTIFEWAAREFAEEIDYQGTYTFQPLGLLNDETDSIGQVHTGFVFLLKGNSSKIHIRSELKEGRLATLDECLSKFEFLESWSKIVCTFLKEQK